MTDKQIIIDYKNTCKNYSQKVGCTGTFDGACIKEECFTYRLLQQLIRKEEEYAVLASQLDFEVQKKECLEQECEELKEKCKKYGEINEQETKDYAELKAENEELKKCYKNNLKLLDDSDTNTTKLVNKVMKYEQALKEIKEIAESYNHYSAHAPVSGYSDILQKISEVMDESNN